MQFVFRMHGQPEKELLPQISHALEKRTELLSREKDPELWKKTDKLRRKQAPYEMQKAGRARRILVGCAYLLLGIVLLVPGILKHLTLPIVFGAVGVVWGTLNLISVGKKKHNPFDFSAQKLLDSLGGDHRITFSEEGMKADAEKIRFKEIGGIFEEEDMYLVIYREEAMVLRKKDLTGGSGEEFRRFLENKNVLYAA